MAKGFTVKWSADGIETFGPGEQSINAYRMQRRAVEVLHGRPFFAASFSRMGFRLHVALLRLGREIEREWRFNAYRVRRLIRG